MSKLQDIAPKRKELIIDLVKAAGVDVTDWGNFKGGKRRAGTNPKYCYEWSFVESGSVVVLCLWHSSISEDEGTFFRNANIREISNRFGDIPGNSVRKRRAVKMDLAVQEAFRNGLPIRVVVCEGPRRGVDQPDTQKSRVDKRLLDPVPWAVTAYNWTNGQCVLTRGVQPNPFVDQFALEQTTDQQIERHENSQRTFARNREVRMSVLFRARGKCELCSEPGFLMADGREFLETHHVIPLSEGGQDTEANVVALCPNHHRETHHGVRNMEIREQLIAHLARIESRTKTCS